MNPPPPRTSPTPRPRDKPIAGAKVLSVRFAKAEANGNDFLIVEAAEVPTTMRQPLARQACDRHCGVGADGILYVQPIVSGYQIALYNADGSRAEISGNGSRCVAAVGAERDQRLEGTMHTGAGPRRYRVLGRSGEGWDVVMVMGRPRFAATDIPLGNFPGSRQTALARRKMRGWVLSMGNPHCSVFVKHIAVDWPKLGLRVSGNRRFPGKVNVELVQVLTRHRIEARFFERGVGPTLSSGTGSCAAAVSAIESGQAMSPVEVLSMGGTQTVEWGGGAKPVLLRGPARLLAEGVFYYRVAAV